MLIVWTRGVETIRRQETGTRTAVQMYTVSVENERRETEIVRACVVKGKRR